jgi:hypothetical protein
MSTSFDVWATSLGLATFLPLFAGPDDFLGAEKSKILGYFLARQQFIGSFP